jgi:hypothetical protein
MSDTPAEHTATHALDVSDWRSNVKLLGPKVAGAVIAGGVVLFNAWFAGVFSGHRPIDEDNWKFFFVYASVYAVVFYGPIIARRTRSRYEQRRLSPESDEPQ